MIAIGVACAVLASSCTSTDNLTGGQTQLDGGSDATTADAPSTIDGSDAASPSLDELCSTSATAFCTKLASCAPVSVSQQYGGPATCNERQKTNCINTYKLPGVLGTDMLAACASDLAKLSCGDLLNIQTPPSCRRSGKLDDAATCVTDIQCKSAYCNNDPNTGCGKCAPRVGVGQACTNHGGCDVGLLCAGGACRAIVQANGTCGPNLPCSLDLFCNSTSQKCEPYKKQNEACDPSMNAPCDPSRGLMCPQPGSSNCTAIGWVQPGQPCANGSACSGGVCRNVNMVATCSAFPKLGESCTSLPQCGYPFVCIAGQCVERDPAFCAD